MSDNNSEEENSMRPVKVIAVASGKGGVGKTNVTVNLAWQLAQRRRRVLVLDADLGLANVDILLGLRPKWTLADVLADRCEISDILLEGPAGISVIPAASGIKHMADLGPEQNAAIIRALSDLDGDFDVMLVDLAAGIADSVITLARACQHVLVVASDEPTSIADAYALIKVLHKDGGVDHFQLLSNMVENEISARNGFNRITAVSERFLDVNIEFAGAIPKDPFLVRAVADRSVVSAAYPSSTSSKAFKRLAERVEKWPQPSGPSGQIEFFVERLFGASAAAS